MDREILYRGKRIDTGEWVEGYYAILPTDEGEPEHVIIETFDEGDVLYHFPPVDPETVGQYTGLTDENEARIFEGDIIKVKWGYGYQYRYVCYENGLFKARTKADSHRVFFTDPICTLAGFDGPKMHCEVVGNLFDNADLLKSKEELNHGIAD